MVLKCINSYLYVYQGREIVLKRTERKIVAGAALAAGQDNFEDVKSIAAKVYTTFTLKATAAKLDFAACFRYAKCSLHKNKINRPLDFLKT
jgi:hypothetical protein